MRARSACELIRRARIQTTNPTTTTPMPTASFISQHHMRSQDTIGRTI